MSCCSFADLPGDVVSMVADRAAVECRPRMRAACSAWRAAVPVEPQPPWILLHPNHDDDTVSPEGERRSGFSVLSLHAGVNLSPDSSVLRCINNRFPAGSRCVGAGHGWLALVGTDDLSVALVNPVTDRAVSLPPLTKHPMVFDLVDDSLVIARLGMSSRYSWDVVPTATFVDRFVRKIVFSARPEQDAHFAVAITVANNGRLSLHAAFAGAEGWLTLRDADDDGEEEEGEVRDVVHVDGSRFLAVTRWYGEVLDLDVADHYGGVDGEEEEDFDYHLYSPRVSPFARPLLWTGAYFDRAATNGARGTHTRVENYLVLVDGELYQVWASWAIMEIDRMVFGGRVAGAGVARFDPERSPCWSEVTDLGDWAVLIGKNETVAVRAGDGTPRVKGSCLYFMDGRLEEAVLWAFDLRSGQVLVPNCDSEAPRWFNTPPAPVWYVPSLK